MPGMGPPPKADVDRRRRNATVAMTELPSEGRGGKRAPNWPLIPDVVLTAKRDLASWKVEEAEFALGELRAAGKPCGVAEGRLDRAKEALLILERQLGEQRKLEATLWKELWRLPQAVQWEALGWTRDVAQYVRHKVMAELGDLDSAKEARQWSDRLGLTPLAMLRLRWKVVVDETAARRQERQQTAAQAGPGVSARQRLRVVDPAGA
ncbi:hypothetical protein ABZS66_19165 [Dactylosporangium sp. NPDC005572]|uniref:hypothetical protein n=1 Tax=Dactylosporangium sp. NPDC005572 TaxID=3156889 RepID=UPI0033AD7B34